MALEPASLLLALTPHSRKCCSSQSRAEQSSSLFLAQCRGLPTVRLISSLPLQTDITFPMIGAASLPRWAAARPHPVSSLGPVLLLRALIRSWGCRIGVAVFVHPHGWWGQLCIWGDGTSPMRICCQVGVESLVHTVVPVVVFAVWRSGRSSQEGAPWSPGSLWKGREGSWWSCA